MSKTEPKLDMEWIDEVRVNRSAVDRRVATLTKRRTVKKEWQAAWLLKAISCIDLTTLSGDDTEGHVKRLCAKAAHPLRTDLRDQLGLEQGPLTVAAVCVYHQYVAVAKKELEKAKLYPNQVGIAAVSTGFPAGLSPMEERVREIEASVRAGATEIDIVISRGLVLRGEWRALFDEVVAFKQACGNAHMKTILATGELATLRNVYKASLVCMMAGADFIKTSTGKESVNANLIVGLTMVRAIREFFERTGKVVGFKPAGGIKTAKQAIEWLIMIKEELGDDWLTSTRFRFGASSLLTDIERQLEYFITGHYSANYRHPTV